MSTDYHVRCTTCGADDSTEWQNQFSPRAVISSLLPALVALSKATPSDVDVEILVDQRPLSLSWLLEHRGHVLEVYDEYGCRDGQCYHWVKCDSCTAKHHCVLDLGHEGDHQPKKPE